MRHLFSLAIVIAFLSLALFSTRAWAESEPAAVQATEQDAGPKLAVAIDPISLLYGTYAGSITKVATPHVAVRLDGQISEGSPGLIDSGGWRASVSLPIFFDRALHGPYIEPGVVVANRLVGYSIVPTNDPNAPMYLALHDHTMGPQIFVGWQWTFRSGLTLAAAIGASRNVPSNGYGTAYPLPESYMRVGYAF